MKRCVLAVQRALDDLTLARARRGEPAACAEVVRRYQRMVYAVLSRLCPGAPDTVDDLAQDTFVKVLRALPNFDPNGPAKLSTWMVTIATRTAIDRRRTQRGATPRNDRPDDHRQDSWQDQTEARLLKDRVERVMIQLDDDHRAVLVLRAYHDLDYPEIAEILQVPVGTVKSRLARARTALKTLLKEDAS